ncbi:putative methyltransferase SCDLUD_004170 [Saccharomycodes ludwigii]|uniref:putative methyltransferase n=1 Tax=Saccharomycodes ludwigii TaxID=36035 RepID=UPI001E892537|nr:hypothetical protein SCDLUD_004170 [Saccharomycodes ludwigii]KAH3899871.1 hypothetical protein SCDLUD_004170 [Saccharomycodes ludwigii]
MTSTTDKQSSTSIPPVFHNNDKGTFGYYTATERWPIIISNCINDLDNHLNQLSANLLKEGVADYELIESSGKVIKNKILALRKDIVKGDVLLEKFPEKLIAKRPIYKDFNLYLENPDDGQPPNSLTWANSGWLFSEVYLYNRIHQYFLESGSAYWIKQFDIFNAVKQSTFKSSIYGVLELAIKYKNLHPKFINELTYNAEGTNLDTLQILFNEFVEISLWGNATDLSLLTNATLEDIKSIQGAEARKKSESKILINDTKRAWEHLLSSNKNEKSGKRVDIICDNSGFELYADLLLALFLLDTRIVDKVVFHSKDIPYMVSDVMNKDLTILLNDLMDPSFFPRNDNTNDDPFTFLADHVIEYLNSEKIIIKDDPFWTNYFDYWSIDSNSEGSAIYNEFIESKTSLIIFKGDLNYRKLTGDRRWDRTTPFKAAIGPLSHNGLPILSLRTCKADVVVGLSDGVDEKLCKEWEALGHEYGSWWCSSGKWAVICFSEGTS